MKYYYTNPISADWQYTMHGMRFTDEEGKEIIPGFYRTLNKFYVHPDSLHLFQPQAEDLCEFRFNDFSGTYVDKIEKFVELEGKAGLNIECNNSDCPPNLFVKIIHRKDIPFHWPDGTRG